MMSVAGNKQAKWYVLQSKAGQEKKAIALLEESLRVNNLQELVEQTFIPSETVTIKKGQQQITKSISYFPGYILIKMVLTDELWHVLRGVSKISGFIGNNQKNPQTVADKEIELILEQIEQGTKQSEIDSTYQIGETVTIIDGPFMDFKGVIDSLDIEKNRLTLVVSIFGRTTPLELEIDKVKPITKD